MQLTQAPPALPQVAAAVPALHVPVVPVVIAQQPPLQSWVVVLQVVVHCLVVVLQA